MSHRQIRIGHPSAPFAPVSPDDARAESPACRLSQGNGVGYGKPWSAYLKEHGFSLTLPPWSILLDDEDACAPDEASYQLALRVMDDLEVVRESAVRYLAQVVDANRWGMHGAPYFNHVVCDAHENRVMVALSWESDIYSEWSVTFVVRTREGAAAHEYHPRSMGYTTR